MGQGPCGVQTPGRRNILTELGRLGQGPNELEGGRECYRLLVEGSLQVVEAPGLCLQGVLGLSLCTVNKEGAWWA